MRMRQGSSTLACSVEGDTAMTAVSLSQQKQEPKTEWTSLAIASGLSFFCALQLTIFFSSLWPYLLQLDPDISETFFGWINAMYSFGQAIMCPFFGWLANRMGQNRLPIIFGIMLMITGNALYLVCPLTSIPAKWIMFFSRMVNGLGAGVITVLRNYAVVASTPTDRSRAISLNMGSFALGIAVGPAIQIIFSPLGYPGVHLFGNFSLDMYTAPAFSGILINCISMALVIFVFRESSVGVQQKVETENASHARFYALPSYDKLAVAVCIATRFAQMFVITNLETIGPPFAMTMFDWNKKETVLYNSIMHACFGALGMLLYSIDIGFNVGKRINHRIGTIVGCLCLVVFHILTFPWWGLPGKITIQQEYIEVNGTTIRNPEPIGCRPSFEWCKTVPPVNMWLFMISYVLIVGFAFSIINVSMNTAFSKIIGPRDQGTLTGLLLLSGCVARITGPIFVSSLFQIYGPRPPWVMEIFFAGGCALLWIIFYKRMVPLRTPDKYSAGDMYKNKHGSVYKL